MALKQTQNVRNTHPWGKIFRGVLFPNGEVKLRFFEAANFGAIRPLCTETKRSDFMW